MSGNNIAVFWWFRVWCLTHNSFCAIEFNTYCHRGQKSCECELWLGRKGLLGNVSVKKKPTRIFFLFLINMILNKHCHYPSTTKAGGSHRVRQWRWWELPRRPIWAEPEHVPPQPAAGQQEHPQPSPGHQAALWECRAVGGPCSAGQGCKDLETSPALEPLGWEWWPQRGWNSVLGHGQGGACIELLTGGKRLERALQDYIASPTLFRNNSQKLLSVSHTWLPRVCIV